MKNVSAQFISVLLLRSFVHHSSRMGVGQLTNAGRAGDRTRWTTPHGSLGAPARTSGCWSRGTHSWLSADEGDCKCGEGLRGHRLAIDFRSMGRGGKKPSTSMFQHRCVNKVSPATYSSATPLDCQSISIKHLQMGGDRARRRGS